MPRKRVNGNIIGARWQDIRHRGEIIAVNRRTGGLEKSEASKAEVRAVNRRTGGLEMQMCLIPDRAHVNRRTGGLERNIASMLPTE